LRDGFKETLWIDADTSFSPDDVERIRKLNRPFVAGLYVAKGPKQLVGKFMPDAGKVTLGIGGGLIEMDYVGMGFTYVRTEVYRKMAESLPECDGGYGGKTVIPFFIPMLAQGPQRQCYLSEDYSFSIRARAIGYPPFADTRLKIGHISGRKSYTWDDLLPDRIMPSLTVEMQQSGEIKAIEDQMKVQTSNEEMMKTIGVQTIRIGQLEAHVESLQAELEQANAARESDALQIKQLTEAKTLGDEIKAERNGVNGVVADVQG
jgi:hypothetical protein